MSIADVDISSILSSGDSSMVLSVEGIFSIDLVFAVVMPVIVHRNPRVFSSMRSIVPKSFIASSFTRRSNNVSGFFCSKHIKSSRFGSLKPNRHLISNQA